MLNVGKCKPWLDCVTEYWFRCFFIHYSFFTKHASFMLVKFLKKSKSETPGCQVVTGIWCRAWTEHKTNLCTCYPTHDSWFSTNQDLVWFGWFMTTMVSIFSKPKWWKNEHFNSSPRAVFLCEGALDGHLSTEVLDNIFKITCKILNLHACLGSCGCRNTKAIAGNKTLIIFLMVYFIFALSLSTLCLLECNNPC